MSMWTALSDYDYHGFVDPACSATCEHRVDCEHCWSCGDHCVCDEQAEESLRRAVSYLMNGESWDELEDGPTKDALRVVLSAWCRVA